MSEQEMAEHLAMIDKIAERVFEAMDEGKFATAAVLLVRLRERIQHAGSGSAIVSGNREPD